MHKIADSLSVTIILNQSHHVFDILPSGSFKNGGSNLKRERLKLDMERTFFFLVKLHSSGEFLRVMKILTWVTIWIF